MSNFIGSIYADTIYLTAVNDIAYGFGGADFISDERGSFSDDFMFGGNGADTLFSWGGTDTLNGGNGRDVFSFMSDVDNIFIDGGNGNDTLKVNANIFAPGETEQLDNLADGGGIFALKNGGMAIIQDVEQIWLT